MKHKLKKLAALVLAVLVAASLAPTAAASQVPAVRSIRTVQDLLDLQRLCVLDTASENLTVVLENDLDISGADFTGIPVFCGSFDGQGHTVSGLCLTASGSVQGFFRYVEEGATVKNLHVQGTIDPDGHRQQLGGVAGINRGTIQSCSFRGTVTGKNEVGGIAGRNEGTGRLIDCANHGTIQAERMVGGVAGQNLGSMVRCSNDGAVNITEVEGTVDPEDIDLEQLNSTSNLPITTDIGGIVGLSTGVLQSCRNDGAVGYAHVGFNVGGIAGRTSGYLAGCTNAGVVLGRRDVGGVAGQLEPDMLLKYDPDKLEQLWAELDTLQRLMEQTMEDAGSGSGNVSRQMSQLADLTRETKDTTGALADSMTAWADSNLSAINDTAARLADAMDQLSPVLDSADAVMDQVDSLCAALDVLLEDAEAAAGLGSQTMEQLSAAARSLRASRDAARAALDHCRTALEMLKNSLGSDEESQTAWKALCSAVDEWISAAQSLTGAVEALQNALEDYGGNPEVQKNLQDILDACTDLQNSRQTIEAERQRIRDELSRGSLPDADVILRATGVILTEKANCVRTLARLKAAVEKAGDSLGSALPGILDETLPALETAFEELETASLNLQAAAERFRDTAGLPEPDEESLAQARAELDEATAALDTAVEELRRAGESLDALAETIKAIQAQGETLGSDISALVNAAQKVGESLKSVQTQLQAAVNRISGQPAVQFTPIDSAVSGKTNDLDTSLDALITGIKGLNSVMDSTSDILLEDMKAINRQMGVVVDTMERISGEENEETTRQRFEDVSANGLSGEERGTIASCTNSGSVSADSNVAGIVGSMAVELDVNLEEDLTVQGDRSIDFSYQVYLVVLDCMNTGDITARKGTVGGIAGRMEFGYVCRGQNYGAVNSEGGDYVGGIAGYSSAAIDQSWAKCTLLGQDYVGGIAGYGKDIIDCHTMVEVLECSAACGTIAGGADPDGTLEDNTYLHETLGAVDGVSYAAQCRPVSFDELMTTAGAPERMKRLELTFVADGSVVAVVPFQYGGGVDSLPAIPAKEGCSAQWPDLDYQHLTFSQTVEAVYIPYSSALADNDELPTLLVDGSFSSSAAIESSTEEVTFTDEKGREHTGTAWTVTVTDPVFEAPDCTVHYRKPDKSTKYTVWVSTPDGWTVHDHSVDGSYLLIDCPGGTVTFLAEPIISEGKAWQIAGGIGGAAALVVLILLIRRKKRKGSAKEAKEPDEESHQGGVRNGKPNHLYWPRVRQRRAGTCRKDRPEPGHSPL